MYRLKLMNEYTFSGKTQASSHTPKLKLLKIQITYPSYLRTGGRYPELSEKNHPAPRLYNFFMLNTAEHEILDAHKYKI